MKKIRIILFFLLVSSASYAGEYGDWRITENHGAGFGIVGGGGIGAQFFYDYNMYSRWQLHFYSASTILYTSDALGLSSVETRSIRTGATVRRFFSENTGWYIGLGAGAGSVELTYTYDELWGNGSYVYTAEGKGLFLNGELGWQGIDGYYFTVGFAPATYISFDADYDQENVSAYSNHRDVTNQAWDAAKNPSLIHFSFGWHF